MSPAQMCQHVRLSIQASISEIDVEDKSSVAYRLVRPLLYSGLLPKPKGNVAAPGEYVVESDADFEHERDALLAAIERFLAYAEEKPTDKTRHPFFGLLTMRQWRRGHALHLDHHLEQFGV